MNCRTKDIPKLTDVVGRGYGTFWRFKGRYRVVKGSRSSKKSVTTALWIIYGLITHEQANVLVIRKTYRTKDHVDRWICLFAFVHRGSSDRRYQPLQKIDPVQPDDGNTPANSYDHIKSGSCSRMHLDDHHDHAV